MENKKTVIFAFRGDPMCFIHVLLNGIDLYERGYEGLVVIEGDAVTLLPRMAEPGHPLNVLYNKSKEIGILYGACLACSKKLKVNKEIEALGIPLVGDMNSHPSMGSFIEKGYRVITF